MHFDPVRWVRRLFAPIDPWLFGILGTILAGAFLVLMSASPERFQAHCMNLGAALLVMWVTAHMRPQRLYSLAMPLYVVGVLLLVAVALFGETSKGATRWLNLGITRIQPSELMKIAMPLMLAWYFQRREGSLKVR